LLNKDAGLKAIQELLEEPEQSPRRYAAVAKLMQEDLRQLKEDSLDHIARRMDDIRRRLGLGRGDQKVRKVEDGVIESLDKLIKDLEEQQRRQQQASSGSNTQSSRPAPDSRILGGKGPGEVAKKDVGNKDGWGNLPPKQREDAMQQIGREFPSHYRDVIEQYFRKLAGENSGQER
jgi:DNA-binding transcriptional MerR regulator